MQIIFMTILELVFFFGVTAFAAGCAADKALTEKTPAPKATPVKKKAPAADAKPAETELLTINFTKNKISIITPSGEKIETDSKKFAAELRKLTPKLGDLDQISVEVRTHKNVKFTEIDFITKELTKLGFKKVVISAIEGNFGSDARIPAKLKDKKNALIKVRADKNVKLSEVEKALENARKLGADINKTQPIPKFEQGTKVIIDVTSKDEVSVHIIKTEAFRVEGSGSKENILNLSNTLIALIGKDDIEKTHLIIRISDPTLRWSVATKVFNECIAAGIEKIRFTKTDGKKKSAKKSRKLGAEK